MTATTPASGDGAPTTGDGDGPTGAAARIARFLATSLALRVAFAASIVTSLVLIPRPSQPVAVLVLLAGCSYVAAWRTTASLPAIVLQVLRAAGPVLLLLLAAMLATLATAFVPAHHAALIPKVFALQVSVLILFALGRMIGPVPTATLFKWILGVLCVATVVMIVEQDQLTLRRGLTDLRLAVGELEARTAIVASALNRAFLLVSLALAFFVVVARPLRSWLCGGIAAVLLLGLAIVTHSESARLVALIAVVGLVLPPRFARMMLTVAIVTAVVLMLAGPFFYDAALVAWKASPLASFKIGTFLYRLETYADFSALIRDSGFLGRGIAVSKLIANDPSLFAMPNRPCGLGTAFCPWHPHNAGLQVTSDLGFLGIAWMSVALWQVRRLVGTLAAWQQPAIATVLIAFLAVSFVADGLWQPWWWLAGGLIALWIGILEANPTNPVDAPAAQPR